MEVQLNSYETIIFCHSPPPPGMRESVHVCNMEMRLDDTKLAVQVGFPEIGEVNIALSL